MTKQRLQFGRAGEKAALSHLKKKGYRILHRNFRNAVGEIDIIAEDGAVLAFIEVKSRAGGAFGHPLTALTPTKQAKIARTALSFVTGNNIHDRPLRFDVVAVTGSPEHPQDFKVELLQDAFRV